MSRFLNSKYAGMEPYVPGEQPRDMQYLKLNTNESPFPPSPKAVERAAAEAAKLMLYSDPELRDLMDTAEKAFGLSRRQMLFTNGSDEALDFAFRAFCGADCPAVFADVTYGFYKVFAQIHRIPYTVVPLREDFSLALEDYEGVPGTVFIANPNAPTGMALGRDELEAFVSRRSGLIVIDEAYVDFGGESCLPLIEKYDNLLVVQTFSKSRSLAGARLGMAFGCEALINDLNMIKYSSNPYNVNRMTMAAGIGALEDGEYFRANCKATADVREYFTTEMERLGFEVLPSKANFVFAKCPVLSGLGLYQTLKERGILIRHFETDRLRDWNRITIGTRAQMDTLLAAVKKIIDERSGA